MKRFFAISLTLFFSFGQCGVLNASSYYDDQYGFSLDAPMFKKVTAGSAVPVMMYSPPVDGFSSNVNVAVSQVKTDIETYRQQLLNKFKTMGIKLNSEKFMRVSLKSAILFDYEGQMDGKNFRWLMLSVVDSNQIYEVTCTALRDQFEDYEQKFLSCLKSFRLR